LQDLPGEVDDRDRLVAANIEDSSGGGGIKREVEHTADDLVNVCKAADLRAIVVDSDWQALECSVDESGHDHAVVADLSRPDNIEEAANCYAESVFLAVGESEEFIDGF